MEAVEMALQAYRPVSSLERVRSKYEYGWKLMMESLIIYIQARPRVFSFHAVLVSKSNKIQRFTS